MNIDFELKGWKVGYETKITRGPDPTEMQFWHLEKDAKWIDIEEFQGIFKVEIGSLPNKVWKNGKQIDIVIPKKEHIFDLFSKDTRTQEEAKLNRLLASFDAPRINDLEDAAMAEQTVEEEYVDPIGNSSSNELKIEQAIDKLLEGK